MWASAPTEVLEDGQSKKKQPGQWPGCSMTLLVGHEGQQRDLTSTLDGLSELTLMHGAGAGGAAGADLAPPRQETAPPPRGLLVGVLHPGPPKGADPAAVSAAGALPFPNPK